MPAYARTNEFMALVRAANPTYERFVRSSLRPLIAVLEDVNGTANRVCAAIAALSEAKTRKYLKALYHLLATYPGLPANAATNLTLGNLHQTNAIRYTMTVMPPDFQPDGPQAQRVFVTPQATPQNLTLEQFILGNRATTQVMMTHLSGDYDGMEAVFCGVRCIEHINSVLRVARLVGIPVMVLTMQAHSDVCQRLRGEYNQLAARTRVYEPHGHSGAHRVEYRNFAYQRPNTIVMGYDAGVCVFANVFGTSIVNEPDPLTRNAKLALVSMTNVVMSRAGLVSAGNVWSQSATMGQAEYGPIWNT